MSENIEPDKDLKSHRIEDVNAAQIWDWLKTRGGLALWMSVNLSDPGESWTCPLLDANGVRKDKPNWQSDSEPYRIIVDPAEVLVETMKEVKRFRVAIRSGTPMTWKLTDGSTRKLHAACEKAGAEATYAFDYGTQEAIISVPDVVVPIAEWAKKNGHDA